MRWFAPPPARTAYFSSFRQPGVVLRVSRIWPSVPAHRGHVPARERGDAGEPLQEVERDALGREQPARVAGDEEHRRARPDLPPRPRTSTRIEIFGIELAERLERERHAGHDARARARRWSARVPVARRTSRSS
jgi:hypothetical protein